MKKGQEGPSVYQLCDGLTVIRKAEKHFLSAKYKCAFGNDRGEPIGDFIYESIFKRGDSRIFAQISAGKANKSKVAICDNTGKVLTEFYDSIKEFIDGYCIVYNDGFFGLIDENCKVIISPDRYHHLSAPQYGYMVFSTKWNLGAFPNQNEWGIVDLQNHVIIPATYAHVAIRGENLFEVGSLIESREIAGLTKDRITFQPVFHLADKNNNRLSSNDFLELGVPSEGLTPAKILDRNNKQVLGYVDENFNMAVIVEQAKKAGEKVVATINDLSPFLNGKATYTFLGKTRVIEKRKQEDGK